MKQHVLVVVHPGSALGSADFNLGVLEARAARDTLKAEFEAWTGPVVVIHGELSNDLPCYPGLKHALDTMVDRSSQAGHPAEQVQGCDESDYNQQAAITDWVAQHAWNPEDTTFEVTGAWYHPEDGTGCVGSVIERLTELGYTAMVSESVVELSSEEDMDDEPEEEARSTPPPPRR